MAPALKNGDHVLTKKSCHLKANDIVVFHYDNRVLIKRVTAIKNKGLFVQGDNDDSLDSRSIGLIYPENILGKVILTI